MSSNIAQALEHSSRETPEGEADPEMLLMRTLIVSTPDIAQVVLDIQKLSALAESSDERLRPFLMKRVKGYKYALASLSSVGGKMLDKLTTTTQAYTVKEKSTNVKTGIKEMIAGSVGNNAPNPMSMV